MRGWWPSLECLSGPAAVLAEWEWLLGGELASARPFLRPTGDVSRHHPCTHGAGCGCLHEVFPAGRYLGLSATCDCGECQPIELEPQDLIVFGLDVARLNAVIRAALGFEAGPTDVGSGVARSHCVGFHGAARTPVFLCFPASEGGLLRDIEELLAVVRVVAELHPDAE